MIKAQSDQENDIVSITDRNFIDTGIGQIKGSVQGVYMVAEFPEYPCCAVDLGLAFLLAQGSDLEIK